MEPLSCDKCELCQFSIKFCANQNAQPLTSLSLSFKVNNIKFSSEVADICVNKRVICVAFRERVAIFDALSLRDKVTRKADEIFLFQPILKLENDFPSLR